ncbi:Lrp/AsnC family transcriptional regulator [Streptomyces sp. SM18]|nr:Lrp/AsnC family transcriptional regulator [Streptomyces sp. SM18]
MLTLPLRGMKSKEITDRAPSMQDFAREAEPGLDETDLALAHAMQIAPRATWTELGAVLGLSPATAARRWGRLSETGQAWVTATGSPTLWRSFCNAFLDVDCVPSQRREVALALARDARTKAVLELTSGCDLHVNVITRDLSALARFALDHVSLLPGVLKVATQVGTRIYQAGDSWRLNALSRAQREQLRPGAPVTEPDAQPGRLPAADRELLLALAPDGRRTVTELAEDTGASHTATRRRLSRLVSTGAVSFRCEISQNLTGWPVTTMLRGRVPYTERKGAADQLARMPEVRQLVATSGSANILASTWLHSVDDALELEERISSALPGFEIVDHAIVLRTVKRQGWILDSLGRRAECVPIDPWFRDDGLQT